MALACAMNKITKSVVPFFPFYGQPGQFIIQGLYDRIKLNEQLIDAKIDNLVAIKQGEKTSMDTNDNLIEVKKQEMVELESLRNTEIQNIMYENIF